MPFIISAALLLYDHALSYFGAIRSGRSFVPPLYVYQLEPATTDDLYLCTESSISYLVALKRRNADFSCQRFLQHVSMYSLDNHIYDMEERGRMVIRFTQNSSFVPIIDIFSSSSTHTIQKQNHSHVTIDDVDDGENFSPVSLYVGVDQDYQSLVLSDVDYSYYFLDTNNNLRDDDVSTCSSETTGKVGNDNDHCSSESAAAGAVSLHLHDIVELTHVRRLTLDMHLMHHASLTPLRSALTMANRKHYQQQQQPSSTSCRSQHAVCTSLHTAATYNYTFSISTLPSSPPPHMSAGYSLAVVSGLRANQFVTSYWLDYCGMLNHWQHHDNIPVAVLWEQGECRQMHMTIIGVAFYLVASELPHPSAFVPLLTILINFLLTMLLRS